MLRHIAKINALEIEVGVVTPKRHSPDGESIAEIYHYQDQGTKHIPKRETLRPGVKNANTRPIASDVVRGAITGAYRDALRDGGDVLAKSVRREIIKIKSPALKPATIRQRKRGGTNPLVDTGQLLRSIGSKVK